MSITHMSHSGDKRGESPDDRNETSQDNRFTAILFIELMCLLQITLFEDFRLWITEQPFTK